MSYTCRIYKIVSNLNNESFVGSTRASLAKRFKDHKQDCKTYPQRNCLYSLMNMHSANHFTIVLLEEFKCTSKIQQLHRETFWKDKLKPALNNVPSVLRGHTINEFDSIYRTTKSTIQNTLSTNIAQLICNYIYLKCSRCKCRKIYELFNRDNKYRTSCNSCAEQIKKISYIKSRISNEISSGYIEEGEIVTIRFKEYEYDYALLDRVIKSFMKTKPYKWNLVDKFDGIILFRCCLDNHIKIKTTKYFRQYFPAISEMIGQWTLTDLDMIYPTAHTLHIETEFQTTIVENIQSYFGKRYGPFEQKIIKLRCLGDEEKIWELAEEIENFYTIIVKLEQPVTLGIILKKINDIVHQYQYIHRDYDIDNIICEDGVVKIDWAI